MSDRDRRPKAQELFEGSSRPLGKASLDEAYPQIEDLRVEVEESGEGVSGGRRKSLYTKQDFPGEYVDCRNPICYRGGFSLGSMLWGMVQNNKTESEASGQCRGYEGSPKGGRKYRDCVNFFRVKMSVTYKEEDK